MVAELRRHGVPEEQIQAAMGEDGITELPSDPRSEDEREFDAAGLGGAQPHEYALDWRGIADPNIDVAELAAMNNEARAALSAMSFPAGIGGTVMADVMKSVAEHAARSPDQRKIYGAGQKAMLEQLTGGRSDEALTLARHALAKAGRGYVKRLISNGGMESAAVVLQLAHQGSRILYREQLASARAKP